jgi:hypothetical protein
MNAPQPAVHLEALDDDSACIRQLVAELAEDFLADHFGSEKPLARFGDLVRAVQRRLLRQVADDRARKRFDRVARVADTGTISANSR